MKRVSRVSSKIRIVGELFQQNTESRGTISAKYGEQTVLIKDEKQVDYLIKIRSAGELFDQNMKSRRAI